MIDVNWGFHENQTDSTREGDRSRHAVKDPPSCLNLKTLQSLKRCFPVAISGSWAGSIEQRTGSNNSHPNNAQEQERLGTLDQTQTRTSHQSHEPKKPWKTVWSMVHWDLKAKDYASSRRDSQEELKLHQTQVCSWEDSNLSWDHEEVSMKCGGVAVKIKEENAGFTVCNLVGVQLKLKILYKPFTQGR